MLTDHYETDSDEENSNYNHSQVFTNTKVMKKSDHWPLLKCTALKDQIPWGTHSLNKKDPKRKIRLVIIDETEYWHMTSQEL